jgi:hypothetical protein
MNNESLAEMVRSHCRKQVWGAKAWVGAGGNFATPLLVNREFPLNPTGLNAGGRQCPTTVCCTFVPGGFAVEACDLGDIDGGTKLGNVGPEEI